MKPRTKRSETGPVCSFCGRPQTKTRRLMPGIDAYICEDCARLALELMSRWSGLDDETEPIELPKPSKIKEVLDQWVVGQERAKKALSVAVYNHYKRISYRRAGASDVQLEKSNILLVGPTGTGKTLLARTLARVLRVPFAVYDATPLTEAGYVGQDVEAVLSRLLVEADGDVDRARVGIVYLDEVDKLARRSVAQSRDVSGEGVQQALLKMIESSVIDVPGPKGETIRLDTTDILFIFAGSFEGLSDIVAARAGKRGIGFKARAEEMEEHRLYTLAQPEDFVAFGMIPELIGRLPVIVSLEPLGLDDLVEILTGPPNAVIRQFKKFFQMENVELDITPDGVRAIAEIALARGSGARGLRSIVEEILLETMYNLPNMEAVERVVVDEAVVKGKKEPELIFVDQRRRNAA